MHPADGSRAESGLRCMLMRGGTSKGAYFLASDLPADPDQRDDLLLRIMGTPDPRQIDGIGGAHPLTSKVAVIRASQDTEADVDYLFLQVGVDQPMVSDRQNCGNLLAGVAPFAIERGLVTASPARTSVRIRMINTDEVATADVSTPAGRVQYAGDTSISGVPGAAAAVVLSFGAPPEDGGGGPTPFPTGSVCDVVSGIDVTCVDGGMPTVVVRADLLGVVGSESPAELQSRDDLRDRVRLIRLAAGKLMGLGDVTHATIPKVTLVSPALSGGTLNTRSFIPVACHESIGVLCAVSTAIASRTPGSVAHDIAAKATDSSRVRIEHPTGHLDVELELDTTGPLPVVCRAGVVRTCRKLFDGVVFPRV